MVHSLHPMLPTLTSSMVLPWIAHVKRVYCGACDTSSVPYGVCMLTHEHTIDRCHSPLNAQCVLVKCACLERLWFARRHSQVQQQFMS